jgi:hypothetical protein
MNFLTHFKVFLSDVPEEMLYDNYFETYNCDYEEECESLFGECPEDSAGFWFKNLQGTMGVVLFISNEEKSEFYRTFPFTQVMRTIPVDLSAVVYNLFCSRETVTQEDFAKAVDSYFGKTKSSSDDFTIGWSR